MQLVSINDAMQNFRKYYDDVVNRNDVVIVSQNGNLKDNMVLIDLNSYNELQKSKETLDFMMSSGKVSPGFGMGGIVSPIAGAVYVPVAPTMPTAPTYATPTPPNHIATPTISPVSAPEEVKPIQAEMIYELCRYSDGTSVTFSDIVKGSSGEDCVQVNFERSSYYGDDAIRFELPSYKVISKKGHYSEDEISRFKDTLYKNEQSFYKWAREGGPQITVY